MDPWPYDPAKARQLLKEAGYANGFEATLWSAYTHHHRPEGDPVPPAAARAGRHQGPDPGLEPGQRTEWVQTAPDPKTARVRLYYAGWSSSTGEADWGLRPLLATEAWPPKLNNTAYYSNAEFDALLAKALVSTNDAERAELYAKAQEIVMKDAPWAPLVTEQNLYATSARLSGVYVMPTATSIPAKSPSLSSADRGPCAGRPDRWPAGAALPRDRLTETPDPGREPMQTFLLKRLLGLLPTLLIVSVLSSCSSTCCPAIRRGWRPGRMPTPRRWRWCAPNSPRPAAAGTVRALLRQPRPRDLGTSIRTRRPVSTEIGERFLPTLLLTLTSMAWAVAFGLIIGIVSAVYRNEWPDRVGMTLAISGISFPAFALGILLMQIFSVELGWLPTVGADTWRHYVLPSLTLGAAVAAVMARFTRAAFVEVIGEDFVRTARAKGLKERVVIAKHCLRNALIPVVTMMGLQFGFLLGGSIVVEAVFNWPGMAACSSMP